LGKKQTKVPAISQFIEQITRVAAVYIIYVISLKQHTVISIQTAVVGLVIGEMISSVFCLRIFCHNTPSRFSLKELWHTRFLSKELTSLALPLTATRILTNLLQSIENISIPLCLQTHGYSNSDALSTYGVLTGMVLPCILFPSALTNSISTMLLPTVAEIQAANKQQNLRALIRKVDLFGFSFGTACGILFLFSGSPIGNVLFHNKLAGDFIRTLAWICPFLYLNSTLISILNGLGKTSVSFLINICSLTVRICGVWFGIPSFGMEGYLWGLLASQLLVSLLCLISLKLYFKAKR
jgi:stage V sporulation protein B